MMSKQDYRGIAFVLSMSETREEIIKGLCGYLKNDNPRFDITKFVEACRGE